MQVRIYTLAHPVTGEIRYVGRTKNKLSQRLAIHNYEATRNKLSHKNNWIKSLHKQGLRPKIEELDVVWCSWIESHAVERFWIELLRQWGFRLTNSHDMGCGHLGSLAGGEASKKAVHQYRFDGTWVASYASAVEAEAVTGFSRKNISAAATGARPSAHKFIWSFTKSATRPPYVPAKGWLFRKTTHNGTTKKNSTAGC